MFVRSCVHACVHVCVCACVHACGVCVCLSVYEPVTKGHDPK